MRNPISSLVRGATLVIFFHIFSGKLGIASMLGAAQQFCLLKILVENSSSFFSANKQLTFLFCLFLSVNVTWDFRTILSAWGIISNIIVGFVERHLTQIICGKPYGKKPSDSLRNRWKFFHLAMWQLHSKTWLELKWSIIQTRDYMRCWITGSEKRNEALTVNRIKNGMRGNESIPESIPQVLGIPLLKEPLLILSLPFFVQHKKKERGPFSFRLTCFLHQENQGDVTERFTTRDMPGHLRFAGFFHRIGLVLVCSVCKRPGFLVFGASSTLDEKWNWSQEIIVRRRRTTHVYLYDV